MTVVSLGMAYRSFWEVPASLHPPRYAPFNQTSSPRFRHSSLEYRVKSPHIGGFFILSQSGERGD
jgi:hypothetical protein